MHFQALWLGNRLLTSFLESVALVLVFVNFIDSVKDIRSLVWGMNTTIKGWTPQEHFTKFTKVSLSKYYSGRVLPIMGGGALPGRGIFFRHKVYKGFTRWGIWNFGNLSFLKPFIKLSWTDAPYLGTMCKSQGAFHFGRSIVIRASFECERSNFFN